MLFRYFIKIAYEGTLYNGWQIQPGVPTVQQKLQESIKMFADLEGDITGCGRTDTGVHSSEFYAHFDVSTPIDNETNFLYKLNRVLPSDIVVNNIYKTGATAHARFDATSRTYKYYILRQKDPFVKNAWLFNYPLDIEIMQLGCAELMKFTDFSSFSKSNTQVFTNNCHIIRAVWTEDNNCLIFTIEANRFLRNMVRAVVGTMIDLGKKKLDLEQFVKIIESKNRSKAGLSVPARGLFLTQVTYPNNYFSTQEKLFTNYQI